MLGALRIIDRANLFIIFNKLQKSSQHCIDFAFRNSIQVFCIWLIEHFEKFLKVL